MKKGLVIAGVVVSVVAIISVIIFYLVNLTTIAPTEEGVYVSQPYLFGKPHVRDEAMIPGRHFVWPSDRVVIFNATPITVEETFTDIPTSDNVQMDFRLYAKIQLKKGKSPVVYRTLGENWYGDSIKKPYRTIGRNKVRAYSADALRLDVVKLDECEYSIDVDLAILLSKTGAEYSLMDVTIGGVTPPDEVLDESARTAAQKQRIKTQKAREEAETSRKNAETKVAEADQAYMSAMKMTTSEYIQMQRVKNEARLIEVVAKKGDKVTLIMGGGNTAVPAVNAAPAKK